MSLNSTHFIYNLMFMMGNQKADKKSMLKRFTSNINYLGHYHVKMGSFLLAINCVLAYYGFFHLNDVLFYLPAILLLVSPKLEFVITAAIYSYIVSFFSADVVPSDLSLIPLSMLISMPFTALIHCASHNSIQPRSLNRLVGELMGIIQLSGFADWKITHVIHHRYTDDPELDVHPPGNKKFWEFARGMRMAIAQSYVNYYLKIFGKNERTMKALKDFSMYSKFDNLMKIMFWFMLLGPKAFTFLFCTSIVFKMIQFAWLNYSTHRPAPDKVEIKNYNQGWYRVANFLAIGLYFHKNHHLAPQLFDPRNYRAATSEVETEQEAFKTAA